VVRWNDFIIYGVFAREIATQFFPATDPVASLIGAFGVFALGYVSPLGSAILNSLGDRFGRRVVFLVSVLAMSATTIGIGLVPGYAAIGMAAPVLLVLLRLLQGFFVAGELPCSITYVVEEVPGRASTVSGLVIFCAAAGILIATLVSLVIHSTLSTDDVLTYGWRIEHTQFTDARCHLQPCLLAEIWANRLIGRFGHRQVGID